MRSLSEIAFRLRQETTNLWLLWQGPSPGHTRPLRFDTSLPAPAAVAYRLRGSPYAAEIERLAEEILAHRFRLLGLPPLEAGDPIPWRRDLANGIETGTQYFRRIPYLDFQRAGDHKIVWELNRHQHLVLLAQAFLLTQRKEFLDEIPRQLTSWIDANPFQRGINWASALEVGFRALSWMWVFHLVGPHLEEGFRKRWVDSIYQHGLHLEYNLSVYFSPNTHLLGEAVALHALGRSFPQLPRAASWRRMGNQVVLAQMERQVRADGSHYEQSSYYHLYALDFFLLHLLLTSEELPVWYREKLSRMAEFLDALVTRNGMLAFLGDDDGGRLFHPYGDRRRFAGATLATCALTLGRMDWLRSPADSVEQAAWWLGRTDAEVSSTPVSNSRWFADAGLAVMRSPNAHVIVDAGAFGSGSGGHSHADTLSIVAYRDGNELLIDPGTFTYLADPAERERFRGVPAHNTVWIQAAEFARPCGPFRWESAPQVQQLHWKSDIRSDVLDAECRYDGFAHRRSVVFHKPDILVVLDRIRGPAGVHTVEQRWLCPEGTDAAFLATLPEAVAEPAQRSCAFGSVEPARRYVARWQGMFPAVLAAVIGFGRAPVIRSVCDSDGATLVEYEGGAARFPENGAPELVR